MTRKIIIALSTIALAACSAEPGTPMDPLDWTRQPEDPEVKVFVLKQCLGAAQGPQATHYNDWDEAIDSCDRVASNASRYCPAGVVCTPGASSREDVRAILPKEAAK